MAYFKVAINRPQAGYREFGQTWLPILVFDTAEEAINVKESLVGTYEPYAKSPKSRKDQGNYYNLKWSDIRVAKVITGYEKRYMFLHRIQGPKLVELFNGQPKEATDMNPERRKGTTMENCNHVETRKVWRAAGFGSPLSWCYKCKACGLQVSEGWGLER